MGVLGPSQCPPVHAQSLSMDPRTLHSGPTAHPTMERSGVQAPATSTTRVQAPRGQRTSGHLCQAVESPRASWVSSRPERPALSRGSLWAGAHTWPSAVLPPSWLPRRGERCLRGKEEAAPPRAGVRQAAGGQVSPAGPSMGDAWYTRGLRAAGFGLNCGRSPRSPVPRSQAWRQGLQSFRGPRPPDLGGPWVVFSRTGSAAQVRMSEASIPAPDAREGARNQAQTSDLA